MTKEEVRGCPKHGQSIFRKTERGHGWQCVLCKRAGDKRWADGNRERISRNKKKWIKANQAYVKADAKRRRLELRRTIIDHYGGKCACCGETRFQILCIDHINNDGGSHRKAIKSASGTQFYSWIVRNNFPNLFRVLCHNCNNCIGSYGRCMHRPNEIADWWSKRIKNKRYDYMRQRGINLRMKVLRHYNAGDPSCAKCGESTYEFLCLDHLNGGGVKQRSKIGKSGRSTYAWAVKNNFPTGFQVLCYNCNFAKERH